MKIGLEDMFFIARKRPNTIANASAVTLETIMDCMDTFVHPVQEPVSFKGWIYLCVLIGRYDLIDTALERLQNSEVASRFLNACIRTHILENSEITCLTEEFIDFQLKHKVPFYHMVVAVNGINTATDFFNKVYKKYLEYGDEEDTDFSDSTFRSFASRFPPENLKKISITKDCIQKFLDEDIELTLGFIELFRIESLDTLYALPTDFKFESLEIKFSLFSNLDEQQVDKYLRKILPKQVTFESLNSAIEINGIKTIRADYPTYSVSGFREKVEGIFSEDSLSIEVRKSLLRKWFLILKVLMHRKQLFYVVKNTFSFKDFSEFLYTLKEVSDR